MTIPNHGCHDGIGDMGQAPGHKRTRNDSHSESPRSGSESGSESGRMTQRNSKRHRSVKTPEADGDDIRYLIVHQVSCLRQSNEHQNHRAAAMFFDHPRLYAGDCKLSALHGQVPFEVPLDDYLEEHPGMSFIVLRRYHCESYHKSIRNCFEKLPIPYVEPREASNIRSLYSVLKQSGPPAIPVEESITTLSPSLTDAMRDLESHDPKTFTGWDLPQYLQAPYVHLYHTREAMGRVHHVILDSSGSRHIAALLEYLESSFGGEYDEANDLFKRGVVNLKHLPKLFRTSHVIVRLEDGQPRGYLTTDCQPSDDGVEIQCSTWAFDGAFKKVKEQLHVQWPDDMDEMPITNLNVYPLQYDTSGLREKLLARGASYWSCRKRRFISYAPPRRTFEIRIVNPRYMIDMQTYRQLHEEKELDSSAHQDNLNPDQMESDTPPNEEFLLQLPSKILGFGLYDKKWRYLLAEYIQKTIPWNKTAFNRLVLDPDKKLLLTAMVKEHIVSDTSADIIEGKGNGLIILLHGGPGTGKTLTAESVAEEAERPLYRVTGGDIGTDPESVEKYLESVLYIGTIWKAVVLFDESDVFLEERSQADLQRNALVSVFLRVLEYYDGILILTSNRVGTFDEAFKSRVHLALHYPAIDERGRTEIWGDFIQDLEQQGASAKYDQLKSKIGALARDNLNGRQIRNAIRTARQLASQANVPLSYDHLRKAIKVAQEFEQYIVETHEGNTHEDYAKAHNLRSR